MSSAGELVSAESSHDYGPLRGVCCSIPGENVKGTLFFGGAGLDGEYILKMISAFRNAGIISAMYVDRQKWSAGTAADASIGVMLGRNYDPRFPMLLRVNKNGGAQFNLIGYSYGSVIAAQVAMKYANGGTKVNHVVLIGSPISKPFLVRLESNKNISRVVVVNLVNQGDPIAAGMSDLDIIVSSPLLVIQMPKSEGHFYFAGSDKKSDERRKLLAKTLFDIGLR